MKVENNTVVPFSQVSQGEVFEDSDNHIWIRVSLKPLDFNCFCLSTSEQGRFEDSDMVRMVSAVLTVKC